VTGRGGRGRAQGRWWKGGEGNLMIKGCVREDERMTFVSIRSLGEKTVVQTSLQSRVCV
jgi:hypothetical protein